MPSPFQTINTTENNGVGRGTVLAANSTFSVTSIDERGDSVSHRTRIGFSGTLTLSDTGSANGAQINVPIYALPTGLVRVGGGTGSLTLTRNALSTAGTTSTTAAFVVSLGSQPAANTNATLTGTEADVIGSTAFTLVAGTKATTLVGTGTSSFLDGTTTNASIYLNVAVPSVNNTGNNTITVSGIVTIPWDHCGTVS